MKMQHFLNLQPSPKTRSNTRPHGLGWRLTWFVIWTCSGLLAEADQHLENIAIKKANGLIIGGRGVGGLLEAQKR